MAELIARTAAEGLLPRTIGAVTLTEAPEGPLTVLMPFRGQADALSAALSGAHGLALPATGQFATSGTARVQWFGRQAWLLSGQAPDPGLAAHAAVADQTDAWTRVIVSGADALACLARLVPVDLGDAAFGPGTALRTELFHMQAALLRLSATEVEVACFRSMARTLVHDLATAAEGLAARSRI